MKYLLCLIFAAILFLVPKAHIYAESNYVLPYPSTMPGSKFYIINLIKEKVLSYWYFGNFSKFKYNLKLSDKYLVEAKTLFEYKQYFLGINALRKSNSYFTNTSPYLIKAKIENKDISKNRTILREAALKHKEVFMKLEKDLPEIFIWIEEKSLPAVLELKKAVREAIAIREKYP